MERIKEILKKYTPEDEKIFKDTVEMLCSKGIGNGCYQDYTVLMDVISILSAAECIVAGK
jgi:hypothetical protein